MQWQEGTKGRTFAAAAHVALIALGVYVFAIAEQLNVVLIIQPFAALRHLGFLPNILVYIGVT